MAITLGTNIPSLRINNVLNASTTKLSDTLEKLSTGLKINQAKDDAAGLVISENMAARIDSSNQAMKNIQTAKSFLAVAEDGMVSVSDHLQRINDLLTNMANDTNDTVSRKASIDEIIERLDEINRLAKTTDFNGKNMLDGTAKSIIVQLGSDSSENSILDISKSLSNCFTSAGGLNVELPDNLNPAKAGAYDPNNANCRAYMKSIQDAISTLASNRGLLGAYENRLESSYDSMSQRVESLQEAKGVYTDADIALEATNYTSKQILQQMNVSLLANSNSMQSLALSLLG